MTWTVRIPNWEKFQHYGDKRDPPWIKLYRKLLDKREWRDLSGGAAKLLVDLWLLAADNKGEITLPAIDLAWRVRLGPSRCQADLKELATAGFVELSADCLQPASGALATCSLDVEVRGEKETRGEGEVEVEVARGATPSLSVTVTERRKTPQSVEAIISHLQEVETQTERRLSAEARRDMQSEVAFAYWAKKLGHERTMLDAKRKRILMSRLVENGGDLSELLYVVDGALRDDWTMGRDPKSTKRYDGIETIFRDRAQVEKFAALCPAWKKGEAHAMAKKYAGAA